MSDAQPAGSNIPTSIPDKPATLVNSSSLIGYTYDAIAYTLYTWFKGKTNSVYVHYLVYPVTVSQIFDSGGSVGKKYREAIGKNNYRGYKLR